MDTPTRCALRTEFLGGDYSARNLRCESQGRRLNETSFLFVSTSPHRIRQVSPLILMKLVEPWGEKVPQSAVALKMRSDIRCFVGRVSPSLRSLDICPCKGKGNRPTDDISGVRRIVPTAY